MSGAQKTSPRWPFALLFLLLGLMQAGAQESQIGCSMDCSRFRGGDQYRSGSVQVRVRVWRNEAQAGRLQWVLDGYPTGDRVLVEDPALRERILQSIEAIRAGNPSCGLGPNSGCRFNVLLEQGLQDDRITIVVPDVLEQPPQEESQSLSCTLCIVYPTVLETERTREYQTVLAIKTVAAARQTGYRAHRLSEAGMEGTAGGVPVMLAFTEDDLQNARADPRIENPAQAEQRVTAELLKAAEKTFRIAVGRRLLDGDGKLAANPGTDEFRARSDETRRELSRLFDLQRDTDVSWGNFDAIAGPCCERGPESLSSPCANLCGDAQNPALILMVAGVQIIRGVRIRVMPDTLDLQFAGTETGRALSKKREDSERNLNTILQGRLAARPGYLVTSEDIECDRRRLCRESLSCSDPVPADCTTTQSFERVSSTPRIQPDKISAGSFTTDANLIYEVLRRLPADREISLSGGMNYSSEEKFAARVALGELNMLRLAERLSLDFAGGPEVRKLSLEAARPFENRKGKSGFKLREAGISIKYFRDDNQRLGNRTADRIAESDTGSSAHLSFDYDSFSLLDYFPGNRGSLPSSGRAHWTLSGVAALEYRGVTIPENDRLRTIAGLRSGLLPSARSQVSKLSLDITAAVGHEFRKQEGAGLGQISFSLDSNLQRGLGLFNSDYAFDKALLAAHGEAFFGMRSPRDFFLRYSHGIARATGTTPAFELFRMGGQQNIRGMEEGEFIGRRLSYQQSEFGINSLMVWHFLRKSWPDGACGSPCPPQSGGAEPHPRKPIDFSNLYVKAFFDRGRISDPSSFEIQAENSSLPGSPFLLDRSASGYGVAIELRNLPGGEGGQRIHLSIGYARSPQSRLHPSGTLFTGVSIVFY